MITKQQLWATVYANAIINNDPSTAMEYANNAVAEFERKFDNQTPEKRVDEKMIERRVAQSNMHQLINMALAVV